jgi:hypothetical protein
LQLGPGIGGCQSVPVGCVAACVSGVDIGAACTGGSGLKPIIATWLPCAACSIYCGEPLQAPQGRWCCAWRCWRRRRWRYRQRTWRRRDRCHISDAPVFLHEGRLIGIERK